MSVDEERKKLIDNLVHQNLGPKLTARSLVPDEWIDDLRVFRNVTLDDSAVLDLHNETWFYYLFLTAKKVFPYVTDDEGDYLVGCLNDFWLWTIHLGGESDQGYREEMTGLASEMTLTHAPAYRGDTVSALLSILTEMQRRGRLGTLTPKLLASYVEMATERYRDLDIDYDLRRLTPKTA